ncbi:ParM/StbA family protein [Pleurocapsales cyanobacterium LEGE 06147]|nr:ParM/StbA family protein [Pleurocapsales cyanobacterium LEGE 06147]
MAEVTMAADFGASLGRAIYSTSSGSCKPELMLLDPQVVRVPAKSIDNYEKYKIGQTNPSDSAWVKFGEAHLAVGFLAKKNFHAVHCLESLKVDSAIPQALALVGSIAQTNNLPSQFSLSLGILLPWNEFRDREKFQSQLSLALSDYIFRGQQFSVQLESFTALPEGGGIFARGRVPQRPEQKLRNPKELTIAVIMLGYRNCSILVIEKGELTRGATGDFGFARMVQKIQTFTSGQKAEVLVPAICQARAKLGRRVLATLARSQRTELRQTEVEELAEAIADARAEYVALLQNWLRQHLPSQTPIDEFIVSGGTARYLKRELTELLRGFGSSLNWCASLEKRILKTFGDTVSHHCLESRLADVYGLFYKLHDRPLPRLPVPTGDLIDVNVRAS